MLVVGAKFYQPTNQSLNLSLALLITQTLCHPTPLYLPIPTYPHNAHAHSERVFRKCANGNNALLENRQAFNTINIVKPEK